MKEFDQQKFTHIAADKKNKGDGINAVLTLMQDLREFQEKVETCIEAQALADNKDKIEEFDQHLDSMYDALLEIAGGGIKAIRQKRGMQMDEEEVLPAPSRPQFNGGIIGKI